MHGMSELNRKRSLQVLRKRSGLFALAFAFRVLCLCLFSTHGARKPYTLLSAVSRDSFGISGLCWSSFHGDGMVWLVKGLRLRWVFGLFSLSPCKLVKNDGMDE